MKDRNLFLLITLAGLTTGCGADTGTLDLSGGGASLHWPFAEPGGPYDGMAGQPVQFDGSGSSDDEGHALTYEWDFGDGGTSTMAMPTHTYADGGTYTVTLQVCDSTSACNINAGTTSAIIASPANASPGGIWVGVDSDGVQIIALVTETGRFHFLNELDFQGSGILTVSSTDEIAANFRLLTPVGDTFADGSIHADCLVSGSVTERATLNGTVDCTTPGGDQTSVTVNLGYQALYDLDSDLALFGGTWTNSLSPGSDVVNVDAMGVITGQDGGGSGCIYSGQVSIIDPDFNAYDVEWTYSSCVGEAEVLNGAVLTGIGVIDDTVTPMEFIVGATGVVGFNDHSVVLLYEMM